MSSPKIEVFFFYDFDGVPLTGLTPTFDTYKDNTGTNLTQPSITEIGGGAYKFTPDISNPAIGIAYIVNGGSTANPQRIARFIRPEDYSLEDLISDLYQEGFGKWEIFTSGPNVNTLIMYKADGTTVLKQFNLFNSAGSPTFINPFKRVPV